MEKNFHLKEEFAAAEVMAPAMGVDDGYVHGYFPELSFQSVLQPMSLTRLNYSPFDGGVSFHCQPQMPVLASSAPLTYGYASEGFPKMEAWNFGEVLDQKLKMPKQDGLSTKDFAFELLKLNSGAENEAAFTERLINFFGPSPSASTSLGMIDDTNFTGHFSHLPVVKSSERTQPGSGNKNIFQFHPIESSSSSFSKTQINSTLMTMKRSAPYRDQAAGAARRRRQRISDKTRCLEKLLPWNKRMDTATMLEEAYKYVQFLQAQIRVLQYMPLHTASPFSTSIANENPNPNDFGSSDNVYEVLARLNRQQLLEVVVNSPAAQTVLYSRGCCVYSMEQLLLLKKMAEKAAMEQMFFPSVQY